MQFNENVKAPSSMRVSTVELHLHTCQWEILQPEVTRSSRLALHKRSYLTTVGMFVLAARSHVRFQANVKHSHTVSDL